MDNNVELVKPKEYKKIPMPEKQKVTASLHKEEFQADLQSLLENGHMIRDVVYMHDDGSPINMVIAMQSLPDDDPWLNTSLTDEEKAIFASADDGEFFEW